MKQSFFLFVAAALLAAPAAQAQSGTPAAAAATEQQPELQKTDQFVLQNGAVVRRRGGQTTALTENVLLPNGTKVNVKSGIVELPGGKLTTLKEGDYVMYDGSIRYATPQSAAAARGETAPADAKFEVLDRRTVVSTADVEQRFTDLNRRVELMAQKIQLLNQKISLLSQGNAKAPNTSQLDTQIRTLDEQLKAVK